MPKRIQRKRSKGWRMPADVIYVGHGTMWGNPYWRGSGCRKLATRAFEMALREEMMRLRLAQRAVDLRFRKMARSLDELHGHSLACWCPLDQPCHGDVLLDVANGKG